MLLLLERRLIPLLKMEALGEDIRGVPTVGMLLLAHPAPDQVLKREQDVCLEKDPIVLLALRPAIQSPLGLGLGHVLHLRRGVPLQESNPCYVLILIPRQYYFPFLADIPSLSLSRYRPRLSESSSSSSSRSSSRSSRSVSRSPLRKRRYSYSSSRSGSWSRSRSRSRSPHRQTQWSRRQYRYRMLVIIINNQVLFTTSILWQFCLLIKNVFDNTIEMLIFFFSPSYDHGYGQSGKMNVEEVKRRKEKAIVS